MNKNKPIALLSLFIIYIGAISLRADFLGSILSPIIAFIIFHIVFQVFFHKSSKPWRFTGMLLSLSILSWALMATLVVVINTFFHINPNEFFPMKLGYALPNLFLVLTLILYGIIEFQKWNRIQILLDSIVITFCIICLIWLIFMNEDVRIIIQPRSNWFIVFSIASDFLICNLCAVWFLSIRTGKIPLHLRLIAGGSFLYAILDLIYYYRYLYRSYEPSRNFDASNVIAFALFALAGILRNKELGTELKPEIYHNVGRNSKGILLLFAPVLVLLFKGFQVEYLLLFVSIIMLYFLLAHYIQRNIYKEGLLQQEIELNNALELKVKERTEELIEKNTVLENLLNQDFITGLKNRRYLCNYLDKMIHTLSANERIVLLFIDLNRYKMITTMFGHFVGDRILFQVAQNLKPMVRRRNSILTSYGEDAFIYAIKGKYDYKNGYDFAREIIKLGSDIYQVEDYEIKVTANVGISIYPLDANSKESLIKHADIAMSQARALGYDEIKEFDYKLSASYLRRNTIEIMLQKADFSKEFMLYYQPQLLTASSEIIGFEALIRWRTPEGEMIPPLDFIPIAEETGYIIPVGDWVIQTALKQLARWNSSFEKKIVVGINISLKQLNSVKFVNRIRKYIKEYSVEPKWIDLEITESLQLQENPDIIQILESIRSLGITVSIDDFGTGYSSLSYLKRVPVDRIKIARELISQIHLDDFDYQLVKSIITLSKAKGIRVIAEGVEKLEQWNCLKELECDEVQGFYFGRPTPINEIEASFASDWKRIS